jgi:glycosyltransferase involved in cell wall biosynthesis
MNQNKIKILIIQRYFYNFREGFFDYLHTQKLNFKLINHTKSNGRVTVHKRAYEKPYIKKSHSFTVGENIVIFPFLIFTLFKFNPDIIVTEGGQNTLNNVWIYIYSLLKKTPYIQWDLGRGYMNNIKKQSITRKIYLTLYTLIAKKASKIYGYNNESKDYFMSLSIDKEKITILNNTVDTISIKRVISESKTILDNDFIQKKSCDINIIFVGALLPTKNIEKLAEILHLLGENFHLFLIGSGTTEYVNQLKKVFEGTNHSFIGYIAQDKLYPYYKESSFAILPGLGGLAINQAMAYGVPVLCTKADGAEKDLIINGVNGYIYSNIDELINIINSKTKKDWAQLGIKAQHTIFQNFSIESTSQVFIDGIYNLFQERNKLSLGNHEKI